MRVQKTDLMSLTASPVSLHRSVWTNNFLTLLWQFLQSMTLVEAETLAMKTLKQVMEEKLTSTNVELASVSAATGKFTVYDDAALQAVIERLPELNQLGEEVPKE